MMRKQKKKNTSKRQAVSFGFLLDLLLDPDIESDVFLRNVGYRLRVNISQKMQIFSGAALGISDPNYYEHFQDAHLKLNSNGTLLRCNKNAAINFRNVYHFVPVVSIAIPMHCL
jgi:hypothetical protein